MNAPAKVDVKHAGKTGRTLPAVFGSLQREIDRLFDDFAPTFSVGRDLPELRCRMDVADTKDGVELTLELPGLDEKDVEITVSDGLLTVSGEKKFETEQNDKNYRFVERGYGSFSRSIALPDGVKTDAIKATLNKGVLKVVVPTPAKPDAKKIAVTSAA